jgi:hypothetical protein
VEKDSNEDSYVSRSTDSLDEKQYTLFQEKAILAFRILAQAASELHEQGIELLQSTVSVGVPGFSFPKVVSLASPSIKPDALKELLTLLGRDADFAINQAQTVIHMAMYQIQKERAAQCDACPDKDDCDHRAETDTVQ